MSVRAVTKNYRGRLWSSACSHSDDVPSGQNRLVAPSIRGLSGIRSCNNPSHDRGPSREKVHVRILTLDRAPWQISHMK
jgi:hypothetical protein